MRIIVVFCLFSVSWLHALPAIDAESSMRVGVVVAYEGRAVLAFDGTDVGPNAEAYPVDSSTIPPFTVRGRLAKLSEVSSGPLVLVKGRNVPVYETDLSGSIALDSLPVLVVIGRVPPPDVSFSSCTSTEGIHVSLWSGSDLDRVRIWSAYVYLGYNTEPTCSDSELAV